MKLAKRLFLLFSAAMFALSLVNFLRHNTDEPQELNAEAASAASASSEGFLVRSEGDRICIQPTGGGIVRYVDGVRVSDLPEADRLQLAHGFTLPDEAALLALLEDYTG